MASTKTITSIVVLAAVLGGVIGYLYLGFVNAKGTASNLSELKKIIEENKVVAVLFTSKTCPVCERVEPVWRELAREGRGGVVYVEVRFDPTLPRSELGRLLEIFDYYKVKVVPTLLVFKDGSLSYVKEGVPADKDEIFNIIAKVISG